MHSNSRWGRTGAAAGWLVGACLCAGPAWAQEAIPDRAALEAGDMLRTGGAVLRLETEIWTAGVVGTALAPRPGPAPATVVLRLTADGAVVPAGFQVDGLWYVNGSAVSHGVALGESVAAPDGEVIRQAGEVIDADGDGLVDVVVGVRDAAGARHLLKARGQPVRTF